MRIRNKGLDVACAHAHYTAMNTAAGTASSFLFDWTLSELAELCAAMRMRIVCRLRRTP